LKKAQISDLLEVNFREIEPMTHCLYQSFSPLASKRVRVSLHIQRAALSFARASVTLFPGHPKVLAVVRSESIKP